MFSLKNGVLKISSDRSGLDLFIDASFFMLLCTMFASPKATEGRNYIYYAAFFLFVATTVVKILMLFKTKGNLILPSFTMWYGGFALLSLASTLWSVYPANGIDVMSRLIQALVITFCMAQNYATRGGFFKCIRMVAWAGAYASFYLMINTPIDRWFSGKFGSSVLGLNANTIGMIFTICIVVSFYLAFYCNEKRYYLVTLLQLFIIMLTGSRKSLLASAAGIIMLIMMKMQRRNIIIRILMVFGFVVTMYYLIMSVPALYSTIGVRIESMTEHLMGEGGDFSISLRKSFIDHATDMFYERPLAGYGINNFKSMIRGRIGVSSYAHNNYYEMLADLGIVGFVAYYGYYFYLLASLFKIWRKTNSSLVKLMLTWLAVIMICEYGLVTYYAVYIQVTLCCMYLFISAFNAQDDYSEGPPKYLKYRNSQYG